MPGTCGICASEEDREQNRINRDIEGQLERDSRRAKADWNLLFQGAGESGKSTFIKQMRIIHGAGFSEAKRRKYAALVVRQIYQIMQTLIHAMELLNIPYASAQSEKKSRVIMDVNVETVKTFNPDAATTSAGASHVQFIEDLWNDKGIQVAFERRREYQLSDSAKYYMDELARISAEGYIPTDQDILRVRKPTTSISEYSFAMEKVTIRMIDVGGQRTERRKWIHCFDNVTAVMFLVAISEYDQVLREDGNVNRLKESLALFCQVATQKVFENASIMLFLNKKDIFEEKILKSNLVDYFPEYADGPRSDHLAARNFILRKLLELVPAGKTVYPHFTCATDTDNIKIVFAAVSDTIMQLNLKSYAMI